ncbi:MAG: glycine zipper domain-containing protein [Polaromonas sp.]
MEKTTAYMDGHAADAQANAASALQRGLESTGDALHSRIDKMANPARHALDSMSSSAHSTVDALASSASHTATRFADQARRLTQAPSKAVGRSKLMIQDRPFQAIGIALAAGFVIGRLTSR